MQDLHKICHQEYNESGHPRDRHAGGEGSEEISDTENNSMGFRMGKKYIYGIF